MVEVDPQREQVIRQELGRILASSLFARSGRLCRFLTFSVEKALQGESDRVKEYVVGVEAFGRGTPFEFAISNGDGEDPMVLKRLIRGLDSPRSEAGDHNPLSLGYELRRLLMRIEIS